MTNMTTDTAAMKLQELKALAEAAHQGKWQWDGRTVDSDGYVHIPECSYLVGNICLTDSYEDYQNDCDFIAACSPAAILALLADRAAMAEHLAAYRVALEHIGTDSAANPQEEARNALIASGEWSAWDFERAPAAQHKGGELSRAVTDARFVAAVDAYMDAVTADERNTDRRVNCRLEIFAAADAWADARRPAPVATFEGFVDGQPRFVLTGEALKVGTALYAGDARRPAALPSDQAVPCAKHEKVLILAAKAVKDRGHHGDARLADSVLGVIAALKGQAK